MNNKAATLCLLFCLGLSSSFAQLRSFELTIHINNIQLYEADLVFPIDNQQLKDKITLTKLAHGTYVAKGELEYPVTACIEIKKKRISIPFFIEPGNQQIRTDIDSLRRPITVIGSQSNKEYHEQFLPVIAPYRKAADELSKNNGRLYSQFDGKIPARVEDSIMIIHEQNRQLRNVLVKEYIKAHPSSYVGFWMLYDLIDTYSYSEVYDSAFTHLSLKIRKSIDGVAMRSVLDVTRQLQVGKLFPSLKLVDTLGKENALGATYNRYTLVDFWYSNCHPCIEQFEKLKELYAHYSTKGFTIIGVSTDKLSKEEDWKRMMRKHHLPWTQFWDIEGVQAEKLNINLFPTNFLLDESGKIVERDIELYKLEEFLSSRLK